MEVESLLNRYRRRDESWDCSTSVLALENPAFLANCPLKNLTAGFLNRVHWSSMAIHNLYG